MIEDWKLQETQEIRWHALKESANLAVPEVLYSWLAEPHSLTARLRRCAVSGFSLSLLDERDDEVSQDEAEILQQHCGQACKVREVMLYCGAKASVFARTMIPHTVFDGKNDWLASLGTKPLGDALFARSDIQRGEIQIAKITKQNTLFNDISQHISLSISCLWGRRSVFLIDKRPILVMEIFLPEIPTDG